MQLLCQLALLLDAADDIFLAVTQIAQIGQPFLNITQSVLVQLTGHFLTVSRNKRNRIPLIQKAYRRTHLFQANAQLLGNRRGNQFLLLPRSSFIRHSTGIRIFCSQLNPSFRTRSAFL